MWIKERIDTNHMKHNVGEALKKPEELTIQDFLPTQPENDYIFTSLVCYYSHSVVTRHPKVFNSINKGIQVRSFSILGLALISYREADLSI